MWLLVTDAHAAGDRADARIMLGMIEAIDEGDYAVLAQMSLALQPKYRERVGPAPTPPGSGAITDRHDSSPMA